MALDNQAVVGVLNDLIETCEDGVKGFRAAAEAVKNSEAKSVFATRAKLIEQAEATLRAEVSRLGGVAGRRGSVAGAVHRGWIDVKALVTGRDDASIAAECERGEDAAVRSYEAALQKDLPTGVRVIVERQYQGALQNRDRVRALSTSTSSVSSSRRRDSGAEGASPQA